MWEVFQGVLIKGKIPLKQLSGYKTDGDILQVKSGVPVFDSYPHKTSHQNGGGDEINVGGLSGLLGDAQTPVSHDHTYHSNRQRQIGVSITEFRDPDATPQTLTYDPSYGVYLPMPDAAQTFSGYSGFVVPNDAITGVANIYVVYFGGTTGNVWWGWNIWVYRAGSAILTDTGGGAYPVGTGLQKVDLGSTINLQAGDLVLIRFFRTGTSGSDTFIGTANTLGLQVTYSADM